MGEALPDLTKALVADMKELQQIDEVVKFNGNTGKVTFNVADEHGLAANRLDRLLPDGWEVSLCITSTAFTSAEIQEE